MKINWITMSIALIGLINGALLQFHTYHLDSSQLYTLDQGVTFLITTGGVMYHNRKDIERKEKQHA